MTERRAIFYTNVKELPKGKDGETLKARTVHRQYESNVMHGAQKFCRTSKKRVISK